MSDKARQLNLDPHRHAPDSIKKIYKHYQKLLLEKLDTDPEIIDFDRGLGDQHLRCMNVFSDVASILSEQSVSSVDDRVPRFNREMKLYEHTNMPGLYLIPSMLREGPQVQMASSLLHGCLADRRHKTNVHLHHLIPYSMIDDVEKHSSTVPPVPASFFNLKPDSQTVFPPKDTLVHKPITISQFLQRKLRWITLGGQYDWTLKRYPMEEPPPFPKHVADLVRSCFPSLVPEAAIVNVYTLGDTLGVHRDVSEDSRQGLASISLGCDAIFIVGVEDGEGKSSNCLAIRLRSGDAIFMGGAARFAWHGVPRIVPGTCPEHLKDWPAAGATPNNDGTANAFEDWRGWMSNKRINLNVRQMKD